MARPSPVLAPIDLHDSGTDKQHQGPHFGPPSFGTAPEGPPTIFGKGEKKGQRSPLKGR